MRRSAISDYDHKHHRGASANNDHGRNNDGGASNSDAAPNTHARNSSAPDFDATPSPQYSMRRGYS